MKELKHYFILDFSMSMDSEFRKVLKKQSITLSSLQVLIILQQKISLVIAILVDMEWSRIDS